MTVSASLKNCMWSCKVVCLALVSIHIMNLCTVAKSEVDLEVTNVCYLQLWLERNSGQSSRTCTNTQSMTSTYGSACLTCLSTSASGMHAFAQVVCACTHSCRHDTQWHTKAWKIDGQCQEAIQPVTPQLLLACKHLLVDEALRKAHNQLCGHLHVWHNVNEPKKAQLAGSVVSRAQAFY